MFMTPWMTSQKYLTILQRTLILYHLQILSMASTFDKNETIVEQQFTVIYVQRVHGSPLFSAPLCTVTDKCTIIDNIHRVVWFHTHISTELHIQSDISMNRSYLACLLQWDSHACESCMEKRTSLRQSQLPCCRSLPCLQHPQPVKNGYFYL